MIKKITNYINNYPVQAMCFSIFFALLFGIMVFMLQYKVSSLQKEIATINANIKNTNKKLKVLKTEYSYVTSPLRIRELSQMYFNDYRLSNQSHKIYIEEIPLNPNVIGEK